MLLPHAAGVFITLIWLCSVYYVVYLDIPLRWDYQQLLCIICQFSHYGAGLSLNMTWSYSVYYVVIQTFP